MRLNKIIPDMLVAMSAVLLQSCLKDQEDLFDNSASERLQMVLDNTKRILESSDRKSVV